MKNTQRQFYFACSLIFASIPTFACDIFTGERSQLITLSANGNNIDNWQVDTNAIKNIALPNGFALGVKIEPATKAKYTELAKAWPHMPEMVKITLYDMTANTPRQLTYTWGGANSIQGYGALGGADRVNVLGSPGIKLILHKASCAKIKSA